MKQFKQILSQILPEIIAIRHAIHENPELSNQEFGTALLVQNTLENSGFQTVSKVGDTGVTALLDSGKPGKTVALRADLDALPILEETNLSYRSKNTNVMHACGHDGHTATLLAVALTLIKCDLDFFGKIKFIFQPAEEGGFGAKKLINQGILTHPKVDAIFGYHNMTGATAGTVLVKSGCMMAGGGIFSIIIRGRGGHAAQVGSFIDPIYIGTQMVQALQSIVSRYTQETEPVIISVTQFHAGNTFNVIPDETRLNGTFRVVSNESLTFIKEEINKVVIEIASASGASAEIIFDQDFLPTINHPRETALLMQTATRLLGNKRVIQMQVPSMASEDFALYLEQIPGCFFFVGTGETHGLHHSHYNFNDEIIPVAAEVMASVALEYLKYDKLN